MGSWLNFLSDVTLWTVAVIGIFEGARRLTLGGPRRTPVLLLIGGIGWCVFNSALAFYVSPKLDSLKVSEPDKPVSELATVWDNYFPLEERERKSRVYAALIYSSTGKLVSHFDATGKRRQFVPTQEELRERESVVVLQQQMDSLARETYTRGFRLTVPAFLALLIGWLTGRHQRRMAANPTVERDAQRSARPSP